MCLSEAPAFDNCVSAWAADMGMLLGQCKVDGKSNEITTIPELLRLLHLKGCIVTIDAIGCPNQRHMHAVVQKHFGTSGGDVPVKDNTYAECFTGHGRQEHRSYKVSPTSPRRWRERQRIGLDMPAWSRWCASASRQTRLPATRSATT